VRCSPLTGLARVMTILESCPGTVAKEVFYRHGIPQASLLTWISHARLEGIQVESVRCLGYRLVRG